MKQTLKGRAHVTAQSAMNTKFDHLLACIGEECGEVQQVVGKATRFGILDTNPKTKRTNWVELRKEIHDLVAVYEMLCDEFDRVETLDRRLIEKKKKRVLKYMGYAEQVGQLQADHLGDLVSSFNPGSTIPKCGQCDVFLVNTATRSNFCPNCNCTVIETK